MQRSIKRTCLCSDCIAGNNDEKNCREAKEIRLSRMSLIHRVKGWSKKRIGIIKNSSERACESNKTYRRLSLSFKRWRAGDVKIDRYSIDAVFSMSSIFS